MRLLLVDDDPRTAKYLARALLESGHVVDHTMDGATGLGMVHEAIYDAVIVERDVPGLAGLALVRRLRSLDAGIGVLMLSLQDSVQDRIDALQAGCDDHIAKPYAYTEVLARLEAIARRSMQARRHGTLQVADLQLDIGARRATRAGREIRLQQREFLILEFLMRHAHEVVTRAMLLEAAWNYDFEPRSSVVDTQLHRLRVKVDLHAACPLIRTVAGVGYVLSDRNKAEALAQR